MNHELRTSGIRVLVHTYTTLRENACSLYYVEFEGGIRHWELLVEGEVARILRAELWVDGVCFTREQIMRETDDYAGMLLKHPGMCTGELAAGWSYQRFSCPCEPCRKYAHLHGRCVEATCVHTHSWLVPDVGVADSMEAQ